MFDNIQQLFSVYLRGKLIQVKMSLYKLMDLDHFTIDKKSQFWKWKNICWLISPDFFDEWFEYFSIPGIIFYLAFPKWHKQKHIEFWTWITLPLSHSYGNHSNRGYRLLVHNIFMQYINSPVKLEFEVKQIATEFILLSWSSTNSSSSHIKSIEFLGLRNFLRKRFMPKPLYRIHWLGYGFKTLVEVLTANFNSRVEQEDDSEAEL